jgi:hypothetical protein
MLSLTNQEDLNDLEKKIRIKITFDLPKTILKEKSIDGFKSFGELKRQDKISQIKKAHLKKNEKRCHLNQV